MIRRTLAAAALAAAWVAQAGAASAPLAPGLAAPLLTTFDDPANHVVTAPSWLDGVAKLLITRSDGTFGCSGTLTGGGAWVLTAAHCVTSGTGALVASAASVTFAAASGAPSLAASSFVVHPSWTGDIRGGADLALVRLSHSAPADVTRYDILRDATIEGAGQVTIAGYGVSGTGASGFVAGSFGTLHSGLNRLDTVWDLPGNPFAFDFDNGTVAQDAIGLLTSGLPQDLGFGTQEVMTVPGDSGGPSFIGTLLAGVHSFGATYGPPIDFGDNFLNGNFGELGGDTRVAVYANWIDAVTAVPEPSHYAMLAAGLVLIGFAARRHARG